MAAITVNRDFFERQEQAKKQTRVLVFLFFTAVVLIVLALNLAAWGLALKLGRRIPLDLWFSSNLCFTTSAIALLVIGAGTAFKMWALRGGGHAVAEMTGARRITDGGATIEERRFVNVTEEMSIASGVPLPALYVLDDELAINAFVAGLVPSETVLVVTRGALENLTREELQGVIAHEFSHIFHGDMRLNVRLIGVLAGILLIGQTGEILLRSSDSRHSNRRGSGGIVVLAGLAVFLIGYIGLFFGRLIKAAISRNREFLADAASVQYTRNSSGIAGALAKIGGYSSGTYLSGKYAEDMSHMCFGATIDVLFPSLLATHPPLEDRIRAIDPAFLDVSRISGSEPQPASSAEFSASANVAGIASLAGTVTARHVAYAAEVHENIPAVVRSAVHHPAGAKALICLMLFPAGPTEVKQALNVIQEREGGDLTFYTPDLRQKVAGLSPEMRLPLVEMALPALRLIADDGKKRFLETVSMLIKLDGKITLFEYGVHALLRKNLLPPSTQHGKYGNLQEVTGDMGVIFSSLAASGHDEPATQKAAFAAAVSSLKIKEPPSFSVTWTLAALDRALNRLGHLPPRLKKPFLDACLVSVRHDGTIVPAEGDLVRLVAAYLEVPLPPFLP